MDNLRELDYRLAELRGWKRKIQDGIETWIDPNGKAHLPPKCASDPAACAELDEEMLKRGLYLNLIHNKGYWNAGYYSPDISLEGYASGFSRGATEWEARTRVAIAALEKAKGEMK